VDTGFGDNMLCSLCPHSAGKIPRES